MNKLLTTLAVIAACFAAVSCNSSVKAPGKPDYQMSYTVGDVSFDMTKVQPGTFTMGMLPLNRSTIPGAEVREVALDGFVIMSQPVTNALWNEVMGTDNANPDAAVSMVSWQDVHKFIDKLDKKTGKSFFLPTEAQWEYAASLSGLQPSFKGHSEWCEDAYSEEPENKDSSNFYVNPSPEKGGDEKVIRTLTERDHLGGYIRKAKLGFRLVQPTEEKLDETFLQTLAGTIQDREKVSAEGGKTESVKVGDVDIVMVKVKGGTFRMGFSETDKTFLNSAIPQNERNVHDVTLDDFEIGRTEVTVAQWNAVMGNVPYMNDVEDGNKPVSNVSWYDCQRFVRKLNSLTGRKFRLPTEAEWEYAAGGGQETKQYLFSGSTDADFAMWFYDNADMKKQDVGGKKANELGLYDMSGNVWEWCFDRGADYPKDAQTNPVGPSEGTMRVMRGGSCSSKWNACRISNRSFIPPVNTKSTFGLRLAI